MYKIIERENAVTNGGTRKVWDVYDPDGKQVLEIVGNLDYGIRVYDGKGTSLGQVPIGKQRVGLFPEN